MTKKIVVAGSRHFEDYNIAKQYIEECISDIKKDNELVFLYGMCKGADLLGEKFAKENGYQIESYPAEWKTYGRAAGPKRNEKMAQLCDFVICFWDGNSRGTKSMIDNATKYGKECKVKIITH